MQSGETRCSILVLPPPPSAPRIAGAQPPRQFFELDRFAGELEASLGSPVPIVESGVDRAPTAGFVLAFGSDTAARIWHDDPALANRWVPLGVTLGEAFRCVSALGMPAAVTSEGYLEWQHGEGAASGLVVRSGLARATGLALGPSRGSASEIAASGNLPALMVRYFDLG